MTDAHIRRRVSICLIAIVLVCALPAVAKAQPVEELVKQQQMEIEKLKTSVATLLAATLGRKPDEVDRAVRQQEMELEQLKSSLGQANKETTALQRRIEGLEKKPASPEAWRALQIVGLTFVGVWGGVALFREWRRSTDAQAQTEQETIKAVTELLCEARRQPEASRAATIRNAALEYVQRFFLRAGSDPSTGAGS